MNYGTRDVAKMLELSESQVRAYVRSGFLNPERGARGRLLFSFQDLVLLRAAKGLLSARIPQRRVRRALAKLKEQLPEGRPLAGIQIAAEGDRIVVRDGVTRWQPESGQTVFDFDFGVAELAKKVAPLARRAFREARAESEDDFSADDWYQWGCELEPTAPAEARQAYRKAVELDPAHADALVNLGRLHHESGDAKGAEEHYRRALACRPNDATAVFNLGVALEDLGHAQRAFEAYEKASRLDAGSADAHYNAACLAERIGRPAAALRHWKSYRKLIRGEAP